KSTPLLALAQERWNVSSSATVLDNGSWPMSTYQGILLCIIFGSMIECVQSRDDGPSVDMENLVALVRSCHRRGMFNYYNMVAQYHKPEPDDAEALYVWTVIKEAKAVCSVFVSGLEYASEPRC
ncbi:C2H2 type zinc finger domain protein, partial [Macrophomina phaseolina MS6]